MENTVASKSNGNDIKSITLVRSDCSKCDAYKNFKDCNTLSKILALIEAIKVDSNKKGYWFKVKIKVDKPYSLPMMMIENIEGNREPKQCAMNISNVKLNLTTKKFKVELCRLHAYLKVVRKNGNTRLMIINNIKVEG